MTGANVHDARWVRRALAQPREILNDWDPIGVLGPDLDGDTAPVDEYDCLRDRLFSQLLRDADRTVVARLLTDELTDHFGLGAHLVTDDLLDRVLAWWGSVRPGTTT